MVKTADVMMELLDSLNLKGKVFEQPIPREGTGIGVYEAPRGINIHRAELRGDGTVMGYKIIVPTMFNIPVIEEVIRGNELKWAEPLVRAYDPCTSCATHTLELQVREGGKVKTINDPASLESAVQEQKRGGKESRRSGESENREVRK